MALKIGSMILMVIKVVWMAIGITVPVIKVDLMSMAMAWLTRNTMLKGVAKAWLVIKKSMMYGLMLLVLGVALLMPDDKVNKPFCAYGGAGCHPDASTSLSMTGRSSLSMTDDVEGNVTLSTSSELVLSEDEVLSARSSRRGRNALAELF